MKFNKGDILVVKPWMPIQSERIRVVEAKSPWYTVETEFAGKNSRRSVYFLDIERECERESATRDFASRH